MAKDVQKDYFNVTDSVPEEAWYWLALGSIGLSAVMKLQGKDNLAVFIGQWPPTFLLLGIFHRVLKPSK